MKDSFFITSIGRTGTAWLAWLLNHSPTWLVQHESQHRFTSSVKCGLIAPSYLLKLIEYKQYNARYIVLRDPREVAISMMNYLEHDGIADNLDRSVKDWIYMCGVIESALDMGIETIDYGRFNRVDYMNELCKRLHIDDLEIEESMLLKRVNTKPGTYTEFDQLPVQLQDMAMHYLMPIYQEWGPK